MAAVQMINFTSLLVYKLKLSLLVFSCCLFHIIFSTLQPNKRVFLYLFFDRLKQQEDRLGPASSVSGPAPGPSVNESADEHLSRLLEERDTLLRTGVYTHEDRIIAELNRQIQDAMTRRGNL